jgi:hypothetical protein
LFAGDVGSRILKFITYAIFRPTAHRKPSDMVVALNGKENQGSLWKQAVEIPAPGVAAEEVLDRLDQKYQRIADSVSANK